MLQYYMDGGDITTAMGQPFCLPFDLKSKYKCILYRSEAGAEEGERNLCSSPATLNTTND